MLLAIHDPVLSVMPHWVGLALRCLNILLAVWTACFSLAATCLSGDSRQRVRFVGLAVIGGTFVSGTLFRLGSPLTIEVPFFTVGFALAVYGSFGFLRQARR